MKLTFSVTSYFDPFGDEKSDRKILKREFYITDKSEQEITDYFDNYNSNRDYYHNVTIKFKPYKRTKNFQYQKP